MCRYLRGPLIRGQEPDCVYTHNMITDASIRSTHAQVSEALHNFLQARKTPANADLVDRWSIDMETQVNVIAGDGEPVAGKRSTWSNGSDTWHTIRIPKNADTEPTWEDYKIGYPFDQHAEGIGMTGWDWQARRSRAVRLRLRRPDRPRQRHRHQRRGVGEGQAGRLRLPYVEVRRSTGGGGIHLYVYFDEPAFPPRTTPSTPPWPAASWG